MSINLAVYNKTLERPKTLSYPLLAENEKGIVVLFTSESAGVVIREPDSPDYPVGCYQEGLIPPTDNRHGTIIISASVKLNIKAYK